MLNLIATEYIYSLGKGKKEGDLAKLKSQIISEPVFSSIANDIELGNYLYLSNGEISSGGRKRKSILGDAFEALIGAIFKDSDYYTTKDVALRFILDKLDKLDNIEGTGDYKTILQEVFQSKYKRIPEYELTGTKGPDHNKVFEVSVKHNNKTIGHGIEKRCHCPPQHRHWQSCGLPPSGSAPAVSLPANGCLWRHPCCCRLLPGPGPRCCCWLWWRSRCPA